MRYALIALALCMAANSAQAGMVHGYTKKDGTYVQPYYRTPPDGNPYNNYGSDINGN